MIRVIQFVWLIPRNLFIAFIKGWRKYISPIYGDVCRYHPTCSAYGLQQVQQRGFVLGSVFTAWRILRCNPLSRGGLDPVTPGLGFFIVRENDFVVPRTRASKR
jgi:hypothetical protein